MSYIISEIEIHNFRCHKNLKLKFTENSNVIVGANGSGKTSIIEAIVWCLGGSNKKAMDFTEAEVTPLQGENPKVSVTLVGPKTLKITRNKTNCFLKIGKDTVSSTKSQTKQLLQEMFQCSFKDNLQMHVIREVDLVRTMSSKLTETIYQTLGLQFVDAALESMRKDAKDLRGQQALKLVATAEIIAENILDSQHEIECLEKLLESKKYLEDLRKKTNILQEMKKSFESGVLDKEAKFSVYKTEMPFNLENYEEMGTKAARLACYPVSKPEAIPKPLRYGKDSGEAKHLAIYASAVQNLEHLLDLERCPTCETELSNSERMYAKLEASKRARDSIQKNLEFNIYLSQEEEYTAYVLEIEEKEELQSSLKAYKQHYVKRKKIVKRDAFLEANKKQLLLAKAWKPSHNKILEYCETKIMVQEDLIRRISLLAKTIVKNEESLINKQEALKTQQNIEVKLTLLKESIVSLTKYKEIYTGILYPEIEKLCNYFIQVSYDATVSIGDEIIINHDGLRKSLRGNSNTGLCSTISLGIRVALLAIKNSLVTKTDTLNFLILDEVTAFLDSSNRAKFPLLLARFIPSVGQTILVTHSDEAAQECDNLIRL